MQGADILRVGFYVPQGDRYDNHQHVSSDSRGHAMLPQTLLSLLSAAVTFAQTTRQLLPLNRVVSIGIPGPVFTIPNGPRLTITVALCSENAGNFEQRVFLTNSNADSTSIPGPGGGDGVVEIILNHGLGIFAGPFPNGGVLSVSGQGSYEVGVSDSSKYPFFKIWQPYNLSASPNSRTTNPPTSSGGHNVQSSNIVFSTSLSEVPTRADIP